MTEKGDKFRASCLIVNGIMPFTCLDIQGAKDAEALIPATGNDDPKLLSDFHPHRANQRKKSKGALIFIEENGILRCIFHRLFDMLHLNVSFRKSLSERLAKTFGTIGSASGTAKRII